MNDSWLSYNVSTSLHRPMKKSIPGAQEAATVYKRPRFTQQKTKTKTRRTKNSAQQPRPETKNKTPEQKPTKNDITKKNNRRPNVKELIAPRSLLNTLTETRFRQIQLVNTYQTNNQLLKEYSIVFRSLTRRISFVIFNKSSDP